MSEREEKYYFKLRKKMKKWLEGSEGSSNKWSKYLLWAPDLFYLMWKLSTDPEVPKMEKLKLIGAIAYFISPIDLIPEALLGPAAYADDIALTAYVLNSLVNNTNPEVVRKHWLGDEDVLEVIQKILMAADQMVGKGLWQKLKRVVS